MLRATCPKMIVIARLLREKFDVRFTLIARNAPDIDVRHAEAEVFRVNRLMASHRRNCPHCTGNVAMPIRRPRPCPNGPVEEESRRKDPEVQVLVHSAALQGGNTTSAQRAFAVVPPQTVQIVP